LWFGTCLLAWFCHHAHRSVTSFSAFQMSFMHFRSKARMGYLIKGNAGCIQCHRASPLGCIVVCRCVLPLGYVMPSRFPHLPGSCLPRRSCKPSRLSRMICLLSCSGRSSQLSRGLQKRLETPPSARSARWLSTMSRSAKSSDACVAYIQSSDHPTHLLDMPYSCLHDSRARLSIHSACLCSYEPDTCLSA